MKRIILTITPLIVTVALALSVVFSPHTAVQAQASAPTSWSDSLAEVGMPSAPALWQPSDWDTQIHTRDMNRSGDAMASHQADHGADCSAPPATHTVNTWQGALYPCHEHVMTAVSGDDGYGEIVMTPPAMADWSSGPSTISFSVSTQRTTARDWITVDITPFSEQLALPFDFGEVDAQGMPAHYVELNAMDMTNSGATLWRMVREGSDDYGQVQGGEAADGIPQSATVRTPYELVISSSGYVFRVGASSAVNPGKVIISGSWKKALTFSSGVVQFIHHSYTPEKCDVTHITCKPDTWHWSDFSILPAIPYSLQRSIDHQVVTGSGGAVSWASPAPTGAYLKFAAIGSVQVSYDGGKTYSKAQKPPMDASLAHDEHFTSYLTPVPAGATSAMFKLAGGWYGQGMARDFSVISQSVQNGTPPPQPTPTEVPTNTPQPAPTNTPAPSPTPQDYDGPCTVILNDQPVSGVCHGTFEPIFP